MIKRYLIILLLSIPVAGFSQSPEKLIEKGSYDEAIDVCVDRISAGRRNKDKYYAPLKTAFETAEARDREKVIQLKATGAPDIWYDVFRHYNRMQKRYSKLKRIENTLQSDRVDIRLTDYSPDLEAAREQAAAYFYAHAKLLMKSGDHEKARKAFDELMIISRLYEQYRDVELMMRRALGLSAGTALLEVRNRSRVSLSPDFLSGLENISLSEAEKQYLDFVRGADRGQFPLLIRIDIMIVKITPGTVTEKEYTSSHKNPESFEAYYEDREKWEKDRKHPDFNKCRIKEVLQEKEAELHAVLRYIDGRNDRVLYNVPITARTRFENRTATASGDLYACPPEVAEILDKPRKKMPSNSDMMGLLGDELKALAQGIIWDESFIAD
jgi:tetratricopeptide (TPR) repeat protein